jgi:formylglycine-generating enzyme required for sulfatase activity
MNAKDNYRKLQIFCAAPTDVEDERQRLHAVVAELNRLGQPADSAKIILEVLDWQHQVSPAPGRPEGVILEQLPPDTWDIFIGILWLRFGSRTGENHPQTGKPFESGTHEEFTAAHENWRQHGRPHIRFYRCVRPPANMLDLKFDHYQKVETFFAQFAAGAAHEGLYGIYQTPEEFEKLVRRDLIKLLETYRQLQIAPAPPAITTPKSSTAHSEQQQHRYLKKLQTYCNLLPLAAIDEKRDRHTAPRLTLKDVYIDLNTTDFVDKKTGKPIKMEAREIPPERQREETRPLAALEAAAANDRLVILGDPGSGKSAFVNHLLFALAEKQLHPEYGLPKGWPHGALFPIRILLRELAVTLEQKDAAKFLRAGDDQCRRELSRLVHEHLAAHLADYEAPDFAEALQQTIQDGRGLIVFDGLDEAPPRQRELLREAVEAFCAAHSNNRFLVTCRIRSYEGEALLPSFKTVTLAPFDENQVAAFIDHWYNALAQIEQFTVEQADKKKGNLKEAAQRLPQSLVRNPLLLTTIANVHANDVELPNQRVKLYQRAAELLLRRWQEHKAGKISLFEELGLTDEVKIYHALWELGYSAQKAKRGSEAADIPEAEALQILTRHFTGLERPWGAAERFLGFVDQTAGLLIGRGGATGNVYAFPHRTFQEYFAGCHLAKGARDFKRELLQLLPEGDYWQLAAQLGVEEILHQDRNPNAALDVAYFLCPAAEPADLPAWRGVLWAAHFALEIGLQRVAGDQIPEGGAVFCDRLRRRLITILEKGLLPARERAEAGFALARLGDPRLGVCSLPPIWVELPGGKFVMGDDEDGPPHEVELSPFKISKYPITNAQFAEFVNTGGYHEKKWWSKEGWEYRQKGKWEQPRFWDDEDFNLPNQPVVGVSWFEAEAFCNWLSEQIKMTVRLPTEAEWEFAARGSEGRKYPWPDSEPTVEHANYGDLKLNHPTAAGSFPLGATPTGIFDLSGNVWEWCGDWYSAAYYAECKKQKGGVVKNPTGPKTGTFRILRGGAFYSNATNLRGPLRNYSFPDYGSVIIGFRVCVVGES